MQSYYARLSLYFKYSTQVKEVKKIFAQVIVKAVIFIKDTVAKHEDIPKARDKKFNKVVSELYKPVPDALNEMITKDMIIETVQFTFNQIEEYIQIPLSKQ